MKRFVALALFSFVALAWLIQPSFAGHGHKPPPPPPETIPSLQGTTWTGDVNLVASDGTVTPLEGFTVKISSQTEAAFSGTMSDPNGGPDISFAGAIGGCGPGGMQMTTIGLFVRANIMKGKNVTTAVMNVNGSDLVEGTSFLGKLTQQ